MKLPERYKRLVLGAWVYVAYVGILLFPDECICQIVHSKEKGHIHTVKVGKKKIQLSIYHDKTGAANAAYTFERR